MRRGLPYDVACPKPYQEDAELLRMMGSVVRGVLLDQLPTLGRVLRVRIKYPGTLLHV